MKKILIVLGGTSREREVSLDSGRACLKAIRSLGYNYDLFDPAKNNLIDLKRHKPDIIFNSLHGKDGEDGNIQSYFEYFKIPYTHSGVLSSMKCMDKIISKNIFIKNKLSTPRYFYIHNKNYNKKLLIKVLKSKKINYPIVVKPSNEGSSIGVKICKNNSDLIKFSDQLFRNYKTLIYEKFIDGQEIQVAVMMGKAIGAIELRPRRKFYDYKAKYLKSSKTNHIMPAEISKKKYLEVLKLAERAHKVLKCRGVTRCDFKFEKNKFYLLEINTQPGMTNLSLVPEIAKYSGITFNSLIKKIIQDASINR
jgi:D-alanine-D-alanine ligase